MIVVRHAYDPFEPILKIVEQLASDKKLVVEVGPGHRPFSKATESIDSHILPGVVADAHRIDINKDRFPYADKQVDFLYCRHVIEDIYNPIWAVAEMSRVAKAGYIETPSPVAELCRGVDGGAPHWRGYHHHRYLYWVEENSLHFMPKMPIVEHLDFLGAENTLIEKLNESPLFWNTYCFWTGQINLQEAKVKVPPLPSTYSHFLQMSKQAIEASLGYNIALASHFGIPLK